MGIDFNPGGNALIHDLKRRAADLIDAVDRLPTENHETARLKSIAMTEIEGAAHWAVKAAARSAAEQSGD